MTVLLVLILIVTSGTATVLGDEQLPPIPNRVGVAGAFAGVSHGALIVAGGANFPERMPWDGGVKVWHDDVYVLESPSGDWQQAGVLPMPLGYGVSVTFDDAIVCVGGSDAQRNSSGVLRIEWRDQSLSITQLPSLPQPIASASGALAGSLLYIAGGVDRPDATSVLNTLYCMDLASETPAWTTLEPCPGGGRMLAVAAGNGDSFWLVSGVDLIAGPDGKPRRRYLRDAWRYQPQSGWTRIADVPHAVVAAPSPAPIHDSGILILGGDDGSQMDAHPLTHRGFNQSVLHYSPAADRWTMTSTLTTPRVTTPVIRWHDAWIIPSGEVRPGVRSPDVLRYQP